MRTGLAALVLVVLTAACDKSTDTQHIPHVKQLKTVYNPGNHVEHTDFIYDNHNRVRTIFTYKGDSGRIVPVIDSVRMMRFIYAGDNKLPAIIDDRRFGYSQVHHFTYSADGQLTQDSVVYPNSGNLYALEIYSYSADKIIRISSGPSLNTHYDTITMQNGNKIAYRYSSASGDYLKMDFEYDNRINPLSSMNIAPVFLAVESIIDTWSPFSNNNLVKYSMSQQAGYSEGIMQYQYNNDDLPEKRFLFRYNTVDTLIYKY